MLPFEINLPTIAVLALIVAWVVWAIRRLAGRGLCDCGDSCGESGCARGGCSGCSGCGAADKMVADMSGASKESRPHRA